MAVTLYRQVSEDRAWRYRKVNLARGASLAGPYFLLYSLADAKPCPRTSHDWTPKAPYPS